MMRSTVRRLSEASEAIAVIGAAFFPGITGITAQRIKKANWP